MFLGNSCEKVIRPPKGVATHVLRTSNLRDAEYWYGRCEWESEQTGGGGEAVDPECLNPSPTTLFSDLPCSVLPHPQPQALTLLKKKSLKRSMVGGEQPYRYKS